MKIKLFLLLIPAIIVVKSGKTAAFPGDANQAFDKTAYYAVLKVGQLADIEKEFNALAGLPDADKEAYSGALLMRKAGLLKKPREKLESFKTGRIRLETAIRNDPDKVEYRFLRLMIQEHAPGVTKYHDQLEADRQAIREHFHQLPADLQLVIRDYSKGSTVLHPDDL